MKFSYRYSNLFQTSSFLLCRINEIISILRIVSIGRMGGTQLKRTGELDPMPAILELSNLEEGPTFQFHHQAFKQAIEVLGSHRLQSFCTHPRSNMARKITTLSHCTPEKLKLTLFRYFKGVHHLNANFESSVILWSKFILTFSTTTILLKTDRNQALHLWVYLLLKKLLRAGMASGRRRLRYPWKLCLPYFSPSFALSRSELVRFALLTLQGEEHSC